MTELGIQSPVFLDTFDDLYFPKGRVYHLPNHGSPEVFGEEWIREESQFPRRILAPPPRYLSNEIIFGVAVRKIGRTFWKRGPRVSHGELALLLGWKFCHDAEFGFFTSRGRFLDAYRAFEHAHNNGEIPARAKGQRAWLIDRDVFERPRRPRGER